MGVSSRPGSTANMQEVVLDRNVRLIDSPGVVFNDNSSLLGCVDADSIEDPIPPVEAILKRCDHASLLMTYNIPTFPQGDVMVFLAMVAKSYGRVLKGGIPDKVAAARTVLRDWNSGKIPYYTPAPLDAPMEDKSKDALKTSSAKIVSKMDKEINFEKFDEDVMKGLADRDELDFVKVQPGESNSMDVDATKFWNGDDDGCENSDDDAMEVEETTTTKKKKKAVKRAQLKDAEDYDFEDM